MIVHCHLMTIVLFGTGLWYIRRIAIDERVGRCKTFDNSFRLVMLNNRIAETFCCLSEAYNAPLPTGNRLRLPVDNLMSHTPITHTVRRSGKTLVLPDEEGPRLLQRGQVIRLL